MPKREEVNFSFAGHTPRSRPSQACSPARSSSIHVICVKSAA